MHVHASGYFSIYDFIENIYGCDGEQARLKFLELRRFGQVPARNIKPWINPRLDVPGQTSEDILTQGFQWDKYQFPGERQQLTPVANFLNLRKISGLLPGEIGTEIRARMANVAVRADAGDEDLENAIHERRERMYPHVQDILMSGMI